MQWCNPCSLNKWVIIQVQLLLADEFYLYELSQVPNSYTGAMC